MPDPQEPSALYLIGRYRGLGSVMKYNKIDGSIQWHAQFEQMSRINSVSIDESDIFVCGDVIHISDESKDYDPFTSDIKIKSQIARMQNDGEVDWIIKVASQNSFHNGAIYNQDRCVAISYSNKSD